MADKLEQQGYRVSRCDDGTRKILYSENIEIYENWIEGTVEMISGAPVVCVEGLIQMKKKLGREKDSADIALIEAGAINTLNLKKEKLKNENFS